MSTVPAMSEADLQSAVLDLCKLYGLLAYHTHDSRRSNPGFPDLVIVGRRRIVYRELKSHRGRLSEPQREWLRRLKAVGEDAAVWRPSEWPEQITTTLRSIR